MSGISWLWIFCLFHHQAIDKHHINRSVPADASAPDGAEPSAGPVLISKKLRFYMTFRVWLLVILNYLCWPDDIGRRYLQIFCGTSNINSAPSTHTTSTHPYRHTTPPTPGTSMMTSSNGNIFRVTGPLCGEFTGPGEFPAQRPVTRSFDVFFDLRPYNQLSKQPWGWWFQTPSWS